MIGSRRSAGFCRICLHRLVAVHLRHHDVHQHDRRRPAWSRAAAIASRPVLAVSTFMPRRSSTLLSAKMLRTSSSTTSTDLADQVLVGAVQPLEHVLLLRRQVGDHAVQEQRRLVEQPLGRLDALDHDAAGQRVQLRVLLGRQLAAGEHHDRHVAQLLVAADPLEHLEAGHVGQPQVEHHAVARLLRQRGERLRAGVGGHDVDVVVAEQLA